MYCSYLFLWDFHILKKLINLFSHFGVIQFWSVGPLRAALFLSDMSISSSLSVITPWYLIQVTVFPEYWNQVCLCINITLLIPYRSDRIIRDSYNWRGKGTPLISLFLGLIDKIYYLWKFTVSLIPVCYVLETKEFVQSKSELPIITTNIIGCRKTYP